MFKDRVEAGQLLARQLSALRLVRPVVLALPRGGVAVAAPVAQALRAPLDLLLVRKIGAPGDPEFAVGAVAEGTPPVVVTEARTLQALGVSQTYVEQQALHEIAEIARRRELYLHGQARTPIAGCTVVVVDDGLATGATVRAALQALDRSEPARVVLAVPVAPASTVRALRGLVDDLVCLEQPDLFGGVGAHYRDFHQLEDAEVISLLDAARRSSGR
ncbi:MAG: phosphoribosyltransferase [Rhizobacter sp.]|nr:phosphoribosyltransferase [Rhizobacter sp.]